MAKRKYTNTKKHKKQHETKIKIGWLELNGKQNEKQGSEHTKVLKDLELTFW